MEKTDRRKVLSLNPTIIVVAAIVQRDDKRVLITRRKPGGDFAGKWEFPGGKVEADETHLEALRREIREELSQEIEEVRFFHQLSHVYPQRTVELHFYTCRFEKPVEEMTSSAHDQCAWVSGEDLAGYDFLEADADVVKKLAAILVRS